MMNNYGRKKSILQKLICASLAGMMLVTSIIPAMAQTTDGGSSVLDSIEITSMPTKNEYLAGETLDPAGLEVTAHYTGGKEDKVLTEEEYLLQTPDMSAAGTKTVTVSYEEAEITKEATFEISVAQESEPAEESTAEVQENEPAEDATPEVQEIEPVTVTPLSDTNAYELSLSADSVSGDADYINLVSQTTGILSVSANLPSGETGRYIDIYLPDYGFALGSPLPSTDGNITSVERITRTVNVSGTEQTVEGLRLRIADSVDSTLNIQVPYTTKRIGARLDIAWGLAGTLPATGFEVTVYNSDGVPLATQKYGNWTPENVEGTSPVSLSYKEPNVSNSSNGTHISNFPSLSSAGDRYFFQVGIRNAYYQNSNGNTYTKETPYKLRVYVPDPSLIEVTNITAGGFSFGAAMIQNDGNGNWWYELEYNRWTNSSLSDSNYTYGNYDPQFISTANSYINILIYMKKVESANIAPGTAFQVKPLELITRAYGENDLHTYTAEWTPMMRQVSDQSAPDANDSYQFQYNGGNYIASSGNGGGISYAYFVEPGTSGNTSNVGRQESGIDTSGNNNNGIDSYSYGQAMYDYILPALGGSNEEWIFPYEIQPTGFTYNMNYLNGTTYATNNFGNISTTLGVSNITELLEVSYQTSDGVNHIASLSYGGTSNRELYVRFDEIPEGERVVSVNTTWKKWVESFSSFNVFLNYNVATTHEDNTAIKAEEMFQVEHVWQNEDGEVITDSKDSQRNYTHIWFATRPQRCPNIYWVNESSDIFIDIMNDEDRYLSTSILKVPDTTQDTDASSFRDTMSDPQLKLGMLIMQMNGGSTAGWAGNVQTDTQFLTGKMTVMPFLAGWTVKYSTVKKGEQEYVISDDIPEEGLEIQIPLEKEDRFNKIIVLPKKARSAAGVTIRS